MFVNRYDRRLQDIASHTATLADDVHTMLSRALNALAQLDESAADAVLDHDDVVDEESLRLEEEALELISLQQPRREDLRVLAATLRITRDLERIADYACDIAEVTPVVAGFTVEQARQQITHLGELTLAMLSRAHYSFINHDSDSAREVNHSDDEVDALYLTIHHSLLRLMEEEPSLIVQASHLALVARYLERIADHAVNIAEMTLYMVDGLRHPFRRPPDHTGAKG